MPATASLCPTPHTAAPAGAKQQVTYVMDHGYVVWLLIGQTEAAHPVLHVIKSSAAVAIAFQDGSRSRTWSRCIDGAPECHTAASSTSCPTSATGGPSNVSTPVCSPAQRA